MGDGGGGCARNRLRISLVRVELFLFKGMMLLRPPLFVTYKKECLARKTNYEEPLDRSCVNLELHCNRSSKIMHFLDSKGLVTWSSRSIMLATRLSTTFTV